jgi:CubicO group peptidase (beta-lactamase class C family)
MLRVLLGVSILVPAIALPPRLNAQGAPPAQWPAYLRVFDQYVASDSIVGASTLVMRDGRVLAHHETGFGDRELRQRVDTNTIFHWGSITKTLTAIAIMQLVERGKLSLEAPVSAFIPELRRVHNPFGSMDSVTVHMLLSHSAGFQAPTWPWTRGRAWEPFEPTTWEQLVAMMPYMEVAFLPGSRFSYSNPAFIYLARIVEHLTGDPWEAYVQKNIFTPLGLLRSYFNTTPYHLAEYRSNNYSVQKDSTGYIQVHANGRDFNPGITIPNGGWNAPLGDLARYVAFLTNSAHGDVATQRLFDTILPHATFDTMWKPLYPTSADSLHGEWMGLSFFVTRLDGARIVGHTGSQAGFRAFFYWNPENRTAVIAAFNTSNDVTPRQSAEGYRTLRAAAWEMLK